VLTLNSNEDAIIKFIEANTYLVPLESDLYINGQVRKNKEWLYIKESKELVIKGIDNALLAVFK
jgi:prefoldin subunit 5